MFSLMKGVDWCSPNWIWRPGWAARGHQRSKLIKSSSNFKTIIIINLYLMFEGELPNGHNLSQYHRVPHHLLYLTTKFVRWKSVRTSQIDCLKHIKQFN